MLRTAVVIVGFRNPNDIRSCLVGLAAQTMPVAAVVICENGGDDEAARLVELVDAGQYPFPITIVSAPDNPGYGGGINRGLARLAMSPDLVWILNPDAIPAPDALDAMAGALAAGGYDAMGGLICGADGKIKTCGGHWDGRTAYVSALAHNRPTMQVPRPEDIEPRLSFISGANMLLTRRFLDVAGPIREDYFLYVEEVEWCLRAVARGLRLGFCPDAVVRHDQGTSTGSVVAHRRRPRLPIYMDTRNRVLVMRDTDPGQLVTAIPAILASVTLRYLARGAMRQWADAVSGWWAGIANERGKPRWLA